MKIMLTPIITVISSVLVFILGEILKEIWLEPLHKYKSLKGDIAYALVYYADLYSNVISYKENDKLTNEYEIASENIRQLASQLAGFSQELFWIHISIPNKAKLSDAASNLIGLSNGFFSPKGDEETQIKMNQKSVDNIESLLDIEGIKKF